jgi:hypothetical protein
MGLIARIWVPSAAVVPQERGPDMFAAVDGADWSEGVGFYRGFFSAFRIRAGRSVWFHFPIPTPVEQAGQPLALSAIELLWEVIDDARISWATVQHGGMDRIELIPRLTSPESISVPFEPEPDFRPWCPVTNRQLSIMALDAPLPLRFGVQLCVQVSAGAADGTVRFYGAGANFVAL